MNSLRKNKKNNSIYNSLKSKMKYLGKNLNKRGKSVYNEHYKTLKEQIE
jgi:hypothetical protein